MSASDIFPNQEFEAYYDHQSSHFLVTNADGDYIKCNLTIMKNLLKEASFSPEMGKNDLLSPVDSKVNWIIKNKDVDYVGAVAGYKRGYHRINGVKILINKELSLMEPKPGDFSKLAYFFESLLADADEQQIHYFYGWLKVALEGLYDQNLRKPGQALCIAGPIKCGKTLCQRIITELLGGAEAHPYQYLVGETSFNSDLFHACHLRIDDENRDSDHKARKNFGNFLKNSLYGKNVRCHGKGRVGVGLTPHWRLTIAINDNEQNLLVLPEIKSDMQDKIILLKANKFQFPFAGSDDRMAQSNYWRDLEVEFPAFIDYLLHTWKILPEYQDDRSGVAGYQNAELMEIVDSFTNEATLMEMVDSILWGKTIPSMGIFGHNTGDERWVGTAEELKDLLLTNDKTNRTADKKFSWRNAVGTLLGTSMSMFDYKDRITYHRSRNGRKNQQRIWTIFNPNYEPQKEVENKDQNPF